MAKAGIRRKQLVVGALRRLEHSRFGSDVMDDLQKQAGGDATALVSRGFEPVRIERQLIVRAFELVCDRKAMKVGSPDDVTEQSTGDAKRRRAA